MNGWASYHCSTVNSNTVKKARPRQISFNIFETLWRISPSHNISECNTFRIFLQSTNVCSADIWTTFSQLLQL